MKFYHYTSFEHFQKIIHDGEIKTTRSNLLKPVKPKLVNGKFTDVTDKYKPVVWLTSFLDFDRANSIGVNGGMLDKTEVAFAVDPVGCCEVLKWDEWAKKNKIENDWFEALKKTAPEWNSFYICEKPIPIHKGAVDVIFRADIAELMKGATK